jgi:hypothetical protein
MLPECFMGRSMMVENKPNAAVTCSHCGVEILFFKKPKLPEGFSLICARCGRRKIYALGDVRIPKGSNEQSRTKE